MEMLGLLFWLFVFAVIRTSGWVSKTISNKRYDAEKSAETHAVLRRMEEYAPSSFESYYQSLPDEEIDRVVSSVLSHLHTHNAFLDWTKIDRRMSERTYYACYGLIPRGDLAAHLRDMKLSRFHKDEQISYCEWLSTQIYSHGGTDVALCATTAWNRARWTIVPKEDEPDCVSKCGCAEPEYGEHIIHPTPDVKPYAFTEYHPDGEKQPPSPATDGR